MFEIKIMENDAGQRLDKFLLKTLNHAPKSLLYKANRQKKIKCNKKRVDLSTFLNEGDVLNLYLPDEFAPQKRSFDDLPQGQIDIVYQDENVLVVNKPVGVCAHSEKEGVANMRDMALGYLVQNGQFNPDKELSFTPAFANRLDRNTQGLMILGKTATALRELSALIANHLVQKRYLCKVLGVPDKKQAVLGGYIVKDEEQNKSKIVPTMQKGAKAVQTKYTVLQELGNAALVEIDLLTGRSHQIRAHMASIGHPVLGDSKYGGGNAYKYQALCAYQLTLCPQEGSPLYYLKDKTFEMTPWFVD